MFEKKKAIQRKNLKDEGIIILFSNLQYTTILTNDFEKKVKGLAQEFLYLIVVMVWLGGGSRIQKN